MRDSSENPFSLEDENNIQKFLNNNIGEERFTPGLDRIRSTFSSLNQFFVESNIPVVTIGGTNGKGETAYLLGKFLENSGKDVAIWSSPHLLSVRERFYFTTGSPSYAELQNRFSNTLSSVKIKLSYYEFLFLNFLLLTKERKIDVLILEVGLGGRFDTVNLIEPTVTAITSISRDHEEILGRGYRNILFEKLGIARAGITTIFALELLYCSDIASQYLQTIGGRSIDLFKRGTLNRNMSYRERNRVVALELFNSLNLKLSLGPKENAVDLTIPDSKGRFEKKVVSGVEYWFSSAHNLDGIRKMIKEVLAGDVQYDSVLFSFSDRRKEELIQFVNLMKIFKLSGKIKRMFIVSFSHSRAPAKEIVKSLEIDGIEYCELREVVAKTVGDQKLFVTGSYYFLGEFQKLLTKELDALF